MAAGVSCSVFLRKFSKQDQCCLCVCVVSTHGAWDGQTQSLTDRFLSLDAQGQELNYGRLWITKLGTLEWQLSRASQRQSQPSQVFDIPDEGRRLRALWPAVHASQASPLNPPTGKAPQRSVDTPAPPKQQHPHL